MPFTSKQKFNPVPVGEVFIKTIVEEVDGNSTRVVRGLRSQQAFELADDNIRSDYMLHSIGAQLSQDVPIRRVSTDVLTPSRLDSSNVPAAFMQEVASVASEMSNVNSDGE